MSNKEIVLIPPTPADTSLLPLLADIQYLEPMSSEALNRKFNGIVPHGIYKGFGYTLPGGMKISIGGDGKPGTAVVDRDGYTITVQQVKPVELTVKAGFVGHVVLEAIYGPGVITKQVSSDSQIDAASIKLVDAASLQDHHVIIYSVITAAGDTELTHDNIDATDRMEVSLAGAAKVDGGLFVNQPTGCVTIQIRRGLESERKAFSLVDGELAFTTDSERLSIGLNSRAGGTLQPAAKWAEAAGAIALPQGAYQFTKAGILKLPSSAVEGEHVRVRVAPELAAGAAECVVAVDGGGSIATRGGNALEVLINVSVELIFVKTTDGWKY